MAEKDVDLDYHISFPSPVPDNFSSEEDDDISQEPYKQNPTQKETVVILIGWMGCQDKHLEKYSMIYEHRKCITIRYTPSVDKLFYKQNLMRPTAVKILEMIEDLSLEESPIVFHVMSNAGCFLYSHISNEIHSNGRFSALKIRGCVFDSCPSRPRISTMVKAFNESMQVNFVAAYFMTLLFALYMCGKAGLSELLRLVAYRRAADSEEDNYFTTLKEDPAQWPQLFLYSQSDKLVPFQDIDSMIAARRKRGILVLSTCWEDSEHVAHLHSHRETYIKQCYDFLDICVGVEEEYFEDIQ